MHTQVAIPVPEMLTLVKSACLGKGLTGAGMESLGILVFGDACCSMETWARAWFGVDSCRASSPSSGSDQIFGVAQADFTIIVRGRPKQVYHSAGSALRAIRGLQKRPDRARRLGDVGEQLGQRVAHRQGLAAPFLGRQHIVDERAAMQNALLLPPQGVDLIAREGRWGACPSVTTRPLAGDPFRRPPGVRRLGRVRVPGPPAPCRCGRRRRTAPHDLGASLASRSGFEGGRAAPIGRTAVTHRTPDSVWHPAPGS